MSTHLNFEQSALRQALKTSYERLACEPDADYSFGRGRAYAVGLGYNEHLLDRYAHLSVEAFAGVGIPFEIRPIEKGEEVVDIGAGSGTDACLMASRVGALGAVYGIEMTDAMLLQARKQAILCRLNNVTFTKAYAERLPLPDSCADVVISNGAIHVCPDKEVVFKEIMRILKPGGRIQIADVIVTKEINLNLKNQMHLWTDCVAGGITLDVYEELLIEIGFEKTWFGDFRDIFEGADETECAARKFGACGAHILAYKPE